MLRPIKVRHMNILTYNLFKRKIVRMGPFLLFRLQKLKTEPMKEASTVN